MQIETLIRLMPFCELVNYTFGTRHSADDNQMLNFEAVRLANRNQLSFFIGLPRLKHFQQIRLNRFVIHASSDYGNVAKRQ